MVWSTKWVLVVDLCSDSIEEEWRWCTCILRSDVTAEVDRRQSRLISSTDKTFCPTQVQHREPPSVTFKTRLSMLDSDPDTLKMYLHIKNEVYRSRFSKTQTDRHIYSCDLDPIILIHGHNLEEFSVAVRLVWNVLPTDIKQSPPLASFCKKLKTLFRLKPWLHVK